MLHRRTARLDVERGAATAGNFSVGIPQQEAAADEVLVEIQLRPLDQGAGVGVKHDSVLAVGVDVIFLGQAVVESQIVLVTGAAALVDADADEFARVGGCVQGLADVVRGQPADGDHPGLPSCNQVVVFPCQ